MGIIDRSAQILRMAEAVRVAESENDQKKNTKEKHWKKNLIQLKLHVRQVQIL